MKSKNKNHPNVLHPDGFLIIGALPGDRYGDYIYLATVLHAHLKHFELTAPGGRVNVIATSKSPRSGAPAVVIV